LGANGINLLPPEIIEKRESEKRLLIIGLVSLLYIAILVMIYVLLQAKLYQENLVLTQLKTQNALLNKQIAEFKIFEERKAAVDSRRQVIEQAMAGEISWYKLFLEMSMIIPNDIALESLNVDLQEGLKMNGKAKNYLAIAKLMVRLNELDEVENVWLDKMDLGADGYYSFDMSVALKKTAGGNQGAAQGSSGGGG
jgi:Tfp pilus assembly protein PilN